MLGHAVQAEGEAVVVLQETHLPPASKSPEGTRNGLLTMQEAYTVQCDSGAHDPRLSDFMICRVGRKAVGVEVATE